MPSFKVRQPECDPRRAAAAPVLRSSRPLKNAVRSCDAGGLARVELQGEEGTACMKTRNLEHQWRKGASRHVVLHVARRGRNPMSPACKKSRAVDEGFPIGRTRGCLGYTVAVHGQKGFNGVALLSRAAARGRHEKACREMTIKDEQARYIEATVVRQRSGCGPGRIYFICPTAIRSAPRKFPYKTRVVGSTSSNTRHDLLAR